MKRITLFLVLVVFNLIASATEIPAEVKLDKVVFQVSAKDWVNTDSALLTVNINATLNNSDLVKARADILDNLAKIAKGDWHLTQFDRSEDNSGLEKLFVVAQAKVVQADLTNVYQNAKDVSKPGATYDINAIDFKPGLEEIQKVKANLREALYKKINTEIDAVNQDFTKQQYSVNRIVFFENDDVNIPKFEAKVMNTMAMAARAPAPLTVSNEIIMNAIVELASNRQEGGSVVTP